MALSRPLAVVVAVAVERSRVDRAAQLAARVQFSPEAVRVGTVIIPVQQTAAAVAAAVVEIFAYLPQAP
jgi:phosphoribosylcarboxyaminoimidazole (NCAIR) mutase